MAASFSSQSLDSSRAKSVKLPARGWVGGGGEKWGAISKGQDRQGRGGSSANGACPRSPQQQPGLPALCNESTEPDRLSGFGSDVFGSGTGVAASHRQSRGMDAEGGRGRGSEGAREGEGERERERGKREGEDEEDGGREGEKLQGPEPAGPGLAHIGARGPWRGALGLISAHGVRLVSCGAESVDCSAARCG